MTKTEDNPMHLKTWEPSRLRQAPRCLARTRRGTPCRSPAVAGKVRCRMHGGAAGSGGPKGRRNGKYRHGGFTTGAIDARAGYAMEELVAEIGAAFLCADLGITSETRPDHAAYIASCLKVLKDDKRAIFTAASHAQKAADYLHGLQAREAQS
jgi:hypothetical protein